MMKSLHFYFGNASPIHTLIRAELLLRFLARDAFVRTNRCANCHDVRPSVRPSVCPSRTGVHNDHTVHFSADLSLWLHLVQWSGHPDTKACPPTPSHFFHAVPPGRKVEYGRAVNGKLLQPERCCRRHWKREAEGVEGRWGLGGIPLPSRLGV